MRQPRFSLSFSSPAYLATLSVAALLALFTGCEKKNSHLTQQQAEQGLGLPDTSSDGSKTRLKTRCELNETIMDPKPGTPEFVIADVLGASAATGDDNANFERFYSHFPADKDKKWVRDQYWPRAKKMVTKYLQQEASQGIVYKICRRLEDKSTGQITIFIESLDADKKHPPYTLQQDAGAWKIVRYNW